MVVWKGEYLPFGDVFSEDKDPDGDGVEVEQSFRFPGQYQDQETGLYYNYFRDYDPQMGRYVEFVGKPTLNEPNLYVYTNANPINLIDPLGLAPIPGYEDYYADWTPDAMGTSVNASWINPFTSRGGGVIGTNKMTFINDGNRTKSYIFGTVNTQNTGIDLGVSAESVWAWGSGEWSGWFVSKVGNYGPIVFSYFENPSGTWKGFTFGLAAGLPFGAAEETTYYFEDCP